MNWMDLIRKETESGAEFTLEKTRKSQKTVGIYVLTLGRPI